MMEALVSRIRRHHGWELPSPENEQLIGRFESASGFRLPADMIHFYHLCGEASLFNNSYRLMPLRELRKASMLLVGDDTDDYCPSCWYAICDVMDGNYVGINLVPQHDGGFQILDLDHDNIGECRVISRSFELGPEMCKVKGCERLRIRFSVMCRRHHYEQVHRRPCPFDG